ncbi:MAG: N-acetylneuraminate synthase [Thermodesulfobacteriota bacterium]
MGSYWDSLERCLIVAEIGVNHNGDMALAERMITAAKECGADAVKFQTYITAENTSRKARKAAYQEETSSAGESLYDMIKRLELSFEDHVRLKRHCEACGITFFSRASSPGALRMLVEIGIPFIKVGSLDLTYHPLLADMAKTGMPILLSTGASTLGEVEEALAVIYGQGNRDVLLYHCTSNYPTAMADVNLRAMLTLRDAFHLPVGYSDHTPGYEVACAAVALGARSVEKHFTLDRTLPGPDHKASLEPDEFARMVAAIRNVEAALGDGVKRPKANECEMRDKMRRSVVVVADLPAGTALTLDMLAVKRPGTGIHPKELSALAGRKLLRAAVADEPLTWDMIG